MSGESRDGAAAAAAVAGGTLREQFPYSKDNIYADLKQVMVEAPANLYEFGSDHAANVYVTIDPKTQEVSLNVSWNIQEDGRKEGHPGTWGVNGPFINEQERPVDPIKLKEAIKEKETRIEELTEQQKGLDERRRMAQGVSMDPEFFKNIGEEIASLSEKIDAEKAHKRVLDALPKQFEQIHAIAVQHLPDAYKDNEEAKANAVYRVRLKHLVEKMPEQINTAIELKIRLLREQGAEKNADLIEKLQKCYLNPSNPELPATFSFQELTDDVVRNSEYMKDLLATTFSGTPKESILLNFSPVKGEEPCNVGVFANKDKVGEVENEYKNLLPKRDDAGNKTDQFRAMGVKYSKLPHVLVSAWLPYGQGNVFDLEGLELDFGTPAIIAMDANSNAKQLFANSGQEVDPSKIHIPVQEHNPTSGALVYKNDLFPQFEGYDPNHFDPKDKSKEPKHYDMTYCTEGAKTVVVACGSAGFVHDNTDPRAPEVARTWTGSHKEDVKLTEQAQENARIYWASVSGQVSGASIGSVLGADVTKVAAAGM